MKISNKIIFTLLGISFIISGVFIAFYILPINIGAPVGMICIIMGFIFWNNADSQYVSQKKLGEVK